MVVRPTLLALALAGATTLVATFPVVAQDEEAVMIAAARWAQERLPSGSLRLDPHLTGEVLPMPDPGSTLSPALQRPSWGVFRSTNSGPEPPGQEPRPR
jgi:hypothetical protein